MTLVLVADHKGKNVFMYASGVIVITLIVVKARFIRRTLHEPNLIPIKVDPNN